MGICSQLQDLDVFTSWENLSLVTIGYEATQSVVKKMSEVLSSENRISLVYCTNFYLNDKIVSALHLAADSHYEVH
jgi:hypothetical protein